jgi:hypothetical protein
MAQDPWRKAYNLTRARTPEGVQPGTRSPLPAHMRQRRAVWPWVAFVLALLGGGGYYLWSQRGVLIPKYAPELPQPVARTVEQTPLPRQEIDIAALDGGAGIGLAVGADYLNVVGATRDWGVEWKGVQLGSGRSRMSAPGLVVYTAAGRIEGYTLDIKEVFSSEHWAAWRRQLSDAGISPELNWRTATGESQMPRGVTEHVLTGRGGHSLAGEDAETSYMLFFRDGWLIRIEAGLSTGAPVPEPIIEQPRKEGEPTDPPAVHVPPDAGDAPGPRAAGLGWVE